MHTLASIAYFSLAAGAWLIGGGMFVLFGLLRSKEKRGFRWGRGGKGAPGSTLSTIVWGVFVSAVGAFAILNAFGRSEFDQEFITFMEFAFVALLVCAIRDMIIDNRRRKPNQLPDPTSPSVTPAAGAAGAPSVAADH